MTSLVKVASRGLRGNDLSAFIKRAGHDFLPYLDQLRPDEEPLHIIAVGAFEKFSANRNGDAFDEDTCEKRHHTFTKNAFLFRDHQNRPNSLRYGRIIKSAYHKPMARIELLAAMFKTKEAAEAGGGKLGRVADKELEKTHQGIDIPTSMACRVAHDSCSHCHNKAASRNEYCDTKDVVLGHRIVPACSGFGAKHGLTKLGADGRIQCVFNPDADFFDISSVYRNADRISFGLAGKLTKAASDGVSGGAALAELWGLRDEPASQGILTPSGHAALQHLRDLDDAEPRSRPGDLVMTKRAMAPLPASPDMGESPRSMSQAFRALADAHAALAPREWLSLVMGKEAAAEAGDDVEAQMPGIYRRMLDDPKTAQLLSADNPYAPCDCSPPLKFVRWADEVAALRGVSPDLVEKRAQLAVLRGVVTPASAVTAQPLDTQGGAEKLAREYVRYQLAFLAEQPEEHYRSACSLLTAQGRLSRV